MGGRRTWPATASTRPCCRWATGPTPSRRPTPTAGAPASQLHYAVEPEPLDTAGAIRFAATDAGIDERFLVVNGDVLTDLDVTALVAFHDARGAEGTIALHQVDDPSAFGVVPTDGDGRVQAFVEKPPPGRGADRPDQRRHLRARAVGARAHPGGRRVSIERETFPAMVADGVAVRDGDGDDYWLDAGTPEQLPRSAQLDVARRPRVAPPPVARRRRRDAIVDPGAVGGSRLGRRAPGVRLGSTPRRRSCEARSWLRWPIVGVGVGRRRC